MAMNKFVHVLCASMLAGCMFVHVRASNTGHLVVALSDRVTGKPITNAVVWVQVDVTPSLSWHTSPDYKYARARVDTNGIADVAFKIEEPNFNWWIRSPSHYCGRYRLGARDEFFGRVAEKSDYLDINTNTVEGLTRYNELRTLYESGDYLEYVAKFEPKSVTYTNNVIFRSASFYPKRNPQPMFTYGSGAIDYLPMKNPTMIRTNGLESARYKPVDFDMRKGLVVSYDPNHDERWDGPAGEVMDFRIERFRVTTNNIETAYGWIEFAPGCGAYKRNTTGDESFPTTYEADTNATFVSRIPYEISRAVGKDVVYRKPLLGNDEYMVLRTRVVTNEVGEVVSCNYSKVLGPMTVADPWYPSDFVEFKSSVFNPTPNDPNLEYDLKNNLAPRGDGSWYP